MRRLFNLLLVALVLAGLSLPVMPERVRAATWGEINGYGSRIFISFNSVNQTETFSPFVVDVFLDSTKVDFADILPNGADIAFVDSDDVTQLPADNLTWSDVSSTGHLRVRIPQVDAYSNYTDGFWMYYNKAGATSNFSSTSVWSSTGAIGVWELFRTSNNSTTITDSIGLNNLTATNTTYAATGHLFGGTNSKASKSVANFAASNTTGTIIGWSKTNQTTGTIFGSGDNLAFNTIALYANTQIGIYQRTTGGGIVAVGGGPSLNDNTFRLLSASSNGTSYAIASNGVAQATSVWAGSDSGVWFNNTSTVRDTIDIGARNSWGYDNYWSGTIGEVRVYDGVKSPEYQKYVYRSSQNIFGLGDGGFLRYSDSEQLLPSMAYNSPTISMTKDGMTSVVLAGNITALGAGPTLNRYYEYGANTSYGSVTEPYIITANATERDKYGLSYPLTYVYSIPSTADNMTVFKRTSSTDNWSALTTKTSSDIFNGIEAVRFDYTANRAYVSASFGQASNNIYLSFREDGSTDNTSQFLEISNYYDNRSYAVTITMDDLSNVPLSTSVGANFSSRGLPWTGAVITQGNDWANIQTFLDAGGFEVASHSHYHSNNATEYLARGYDVEVEGSKNNITGNLTLPSQYTYNGQEYVPLYIEPSGYSDATLVTQLGISEYLVARSTATISYSVQTWNATTGMYNRTAAGLSMDGASPNLATLNAAFDTARTNGTIYQLWGHILNAYGAGTGANFTVGTNATAHLDYIAANSHPDGWYVPTGALYMYRYAADRSGVIYPSRITSTGTTSATLPETNLTPGGTYHYRLVANSVHGTTSGSDQSFSLTMPSVVTGAVTDSGSTATLSATVSSMGVASDAYLSWEYGLTTAYGSTTSDQVVSAIGAYTQSVELDTNIHARARIRVGSTYSYGSDIELNRVDKFEGVTPIVGIVPVLIVLGILICGGITGFKAWSYGRAGDTHNMQTWGFVTITLIGLSIAIFPLLVEALTNILNGRW